MTVVPVSLRKRLTGFVWNDGNSVVANKLLFFGATCADLEVV
jgi:hypothetical protein